MLRYLWLTALLAVGCGPRAHDISVPPATTPKIQDVQIQTVNDLGRYSRVVKLEAGPESVLGSIEKVKIDPTNEDLLVADFKATKTVYRFDKNGRFKFRLGEIGLGPGGYEKVRDFTVTDEGRVVLLTSFKLILFEADGSFVREKRHELTAMFLANHGNRIYVYAVDRRKAHPGVIWEYNTALRREGMFHPMDPNLEKMLFMPKQVMTCSGDRLYVGEPLAFGLTRYDLDESGVTRFEFPSSNAQLQPVWDKLERDDPRDPITENLQRIENQLAFGDWLYFLELAEGGKIMHDNLMNMNTDTVYRFQGASLSYAPGDAPYLSMDGLIGSYDKGVIGILHNPKKLEKHRAKHPVLSDVRFRDIDNPLLLFFELTPPKETGPTKGENA